MCSSPARDGRWGTTHLHSAVLTGLQPGRDHFYQIEGGPPVTFTAAQPTGPQHSLQFLVFVSARGAAAAACVGLWCDAARGAAGPRGACHSASPPPPSLLCPTWRDLQGDLGESEHREAKSPG